MFANTRTPSRGTGTTANRSGSSACKMRSPMLRCISTEGGPNYQAPDYLTEWTKWGDTFSRIMQSCCRSITVWNIISDEHGRPYVGSGASGVGGAMMLRAKTQEISYSGMFWALGHFSPFVRRGATRFNRKVAPMDFSIAPSRNPGGSLVVVITNTGPERKCELRVGGQSGGNRLVSRLGKYHSLFLFIRGPETSAPRASVEFALNCGARKLAHSFRNGRWSLGGGVASTRIEGDCAQRTDVLRTAQAKPEISSPGGIPRVAHFSAIASGAN